MFHSFNVKKQQYLQLTGWRVNSTTKFPIIVLLLASVGFPVTLFAQAPQTASNPDQTVIYQQLFTLQAQVVKLEAASATTKGNSNTADIKENHKELQALKVQIAKIIATLEQQSAHQNLQLGSFGKRIEDIWSNISTFSILITIGAIIGGFSIARRAKQEANETAKEWLEGQKNEIREQVKETTDSELEKFREEFTTKLQEAEKQLDEAKQKFDALYQEKSEDLNGLFKQAERQFSEQSSGTENQVKQSFSEETRNKLSEAAGSKPPEERNAEDWLQSAIASSASEKYQEAIEALEKAENLLISQSGTNTLLFTRILLQKGFCLGQLNDLKKAVETNNQLIARFEHSESIAILGHVAMAMRNKGNTLRHLNKPEDAIDTYKQLITKFENSDSTTILQQVATAICNKGVTLGELDKSEEAFDTYSQVVEKFKGNEDSEIKKQVSNALANSAELSLLVESPKQTLSRIEECKANTSDKHILAIMQLLLFMLDKGDIQQVFSAIKEIPSDQDLTWGFKEIKDHIEQNYSGEKLQKINAVVAFFEEHKDTDKLAAELGLEEAASA